MPDKKINDYIKALWRRKMLKGDYLAAQNIKKTFLDTHGNSIVDIPWPNEDLVVDQVVEDIERNFQVSDPLLQILAAKTHI